MTNLEKIHNYFRDYESPEQFITVGALFAIASCLGRKVFFQKGEPIFPNEQIVVVAPPGIGKSLPSRKLMGAVRSLYKETPGSKVLEPMVNIAPACTTLEQLYDILERCGTAIGKDITKTDKPYFHSSLSFILADEMGLLFKPGPQSGNLTLFLNAGYDCTDKFDYETKRSGKNHVTNLCVNFFGCCTPDWVERNLDSSVIGNGWSSRVLFIYGEETRQLTTFLEFTEEQEKLFAEVKQHFREIASLYGEVVMTPECREFYHQWYQSNPKQKRINQDSKLDDYYSRVRLHTLKLAMLFHFLEKKTLVLELEDFQLALKHRAEWELNMHKALASVNVNPLAKTATDILRFIQSKPDGATIADIIGEMFDRCPTGMKGIEEAKDYLNQSGKIKPQGNKFIINQKILDLAAEREKLSREALAKEQGGVIQMEGRVYGK